ncbi:hypothetical protein JEQ12_018651 [Ovis aries]|uniref:Uncharacterized protein n=1 Tax=Ovis aries TaxID=9940 RepID=A0A836AA73_SHEEP|nr:hypothetical protein JEQ12_018651 [Ovis aries]
MVSANVITSFSRAANQDTPQNGENIYFYMFPPCPVYTKRSSKGTVFICVPWDELDEDDEDDARQGLGSLESRMKIKQLEIKLLKKLSIWTLKPPMVNPWRRGGMSQIPKAPVTVVERSGTE